MKFYLVFGLLFAVLNVGAESFRSQIEAGWIRDLLVSSGREVAVFDRADIQQAMELLRRTVAYREAQGAELSEDEAAQWAGIDARFAAGKATTGRALFMQIRWFRRAVLFALPELGFEQLLVNINPPTLFAHNGDQHLGRHSRAGLGLSVVDDWKGKAVARPLLTDLLPEGATRNPDLSFDGKRVVFAFCDYAASDEPQREGFGIARPEGSSVEEGELERRYFLYEAAVDGSWVRPLTGTKSDDLATPADRATVIIEDNDPCYLPDGRIMFISTRSQTFGRCHGGRYNPAWVLYRCEADGSGIEQISFGNENEYEPSVLNDGRVAFSRWEYTNRHEMLFHMLWWCRPDGTGLANFYGNDTLSPMMIVEQAAIPGSQKVVATAMGHHQYNTGTLIVIDPSQCEN